MVEFAVRHERRHDVASREIHVINAPHLRVGIEIERSARREPFNIVPRTMTLSWRDGILTVVSVTGLRVMSNGRPGRTDETAAWLLVGPQGTRAGHLPDWVREAINQYGRIPKKGARDFMAPDIEVLPEVDGEAAAV